jgi:hypothetical protein
MAGVDPGGWLSLIGAFSLFIPCGLAFHLLIIACAFCAFCMCMCMNRIFGFFGFVVYTNSCI